MATEYKQGEGKATGKSVYKKSSADHIAGVIAEAPIAKLYLILLIIVYGVTVYSKGVNGVGNYDVALLTFFSMFLILSVISIEILTLLKRKLVEEIGNDVSFYSAIKTFFKRYIVPIIVWGLLFLILAFLCYFSGKIVAKILFFLDHLIR